MCNFFLRKVTTVGHMKNGVSVLCRYPSSYSLVDKPDNFFSKKALTVDYSMNRILYSALCSLIACSSATLLGNIINTG